jgi:hypothetical protein
LFDGSSSPDDEPFSEVSMNRLLALSAILALCGCEYDPATKRSIDATNTVNRLYAAQNVQASAAGNDCMILFIRVDAPLDDSMVESIQYGTGERDAYEGGIQQFAEDRKFRAVAYKDAQGGLWTYGSITRDEARSMSTCH